MRIKDRWCLLVHNLLEETGRPSIKPSPFGTNFPRAALPPNFEQNSRQTSCIEKFTLL